MEKKVFVQNGDETWSATINTADGITMNDTGVAFVRKCGAKWRCVEWFIVPNKVKEKLFAKKETV
jgi:hypothetical protein